MKRLPRMLPLWEPPAREPFRLPCRHELECLDEVDEAAVGAECPQGCRHFVQAPGVSAAPHMSTLAFAFALAEGDDDG